MKQLKDSPFIYGVTVSEHAFANREKDIEKLTKNLLGGINTTVISPRRWGKSSLVEKVMLNIREKHPQIRIASTDLFTVGSIEEFLETFAREVIKATSSKWEEWVQNAKNGFSLLIPKIQIGNDPSNDFSIGFDWQEVQKHSLEVLDLPETIAKQKKLKLVVCLDEFQNIANWQEYESFEKKMRACWQRHKHVTYCLYGSKRHMMADIFNNPSKPFYRFGDIIMLPKIVTNKWVDFIVKGFAETGKQISRENAQLIAEKMKNHSWYVQQLAHYTWNRAKKKASIDDVKEALRELIMANSPLYQREIEILSTTQVNLLKAIVHDETQFTSVKVMQQYHLGTPRNVSKNKAILTNNDIIEKTENGYEFLDPAFERWFRKYFLKK